MRKNRVLALLLAGVAVLALAGCQGMNLDELSTYSVYAGGTARVVGTSSVTGGIRSVTAPPVNFPNSTAAQPNFIATPDAATTTQQSTDLDALMATMTAAVPTATLPAELASRTLTPGVYASETGTFTLNGKLTIDTEPATPAAESASVLSSASPHAVKPANVATHGDLSTGILLKNAGDLVIGANADVVPTNFDSVGDVFWQVDGNVTVGDNAYFLGSVIASGDITVGQGATVVGRLFSTHGDVTIDGADVNLPLESIIDTAPPSAVTGLEATATALGADLTWTAATDNVGVVSYEVQVATDTAFADPDSYFVTNPDGGNVEDTFAHIRDLTAGTPYSFRVRALDAADNAGAWSGTVSATPTVDTTAPDKVLGLKVVAGVRSAKLSWSEGNDNVGVAGYEIEYAGLSDFSDATTKTVVAGSDGTAPTSSTVTSLTAGTPYYFRVRAFDAAGNRGAWSSSHTATPTSTPTLPKTGLAPVAWDTLALGAFLVMAGMALAWRTRRREAD